MRIRMNYYFYGSWSKEKIIISISPKKFQVLNFYGLTSLQSLVDMLGKESGKWSPGPELLGELVVVEGTAVAELLGQLLPVQQGVEAVQQARPRVRRQASLTFITRYFWNRSPNFKLNLRRQIHWDRLERSETTSFKSVTPKKVHQNLFIHILKNKDLTL